MLGLRVSVRDARYTASMGLPTVGTWSVDLDAGYWLDGEELPKPLRPFCGAKCRDGHACLARVVPGKRRCRMHGGLSTGPKRRPFPDPV